MSGTTRWIGRVDEWINSSLNHFMDANVEAVHLKINRDDDEVGGMVVGKQHRWVHCEL